ERIAQPLDKAAGDEYRAFERVAALAAELIEHRAEQSMSRPRKSCPLIGEDERARAIRRLGVSEAQAALPDRRRLLVAREPADRYRRAEQRGRAEAPGAVDNLRQSRDGNAEQFAEPLVPATVGKRKEQRAAGVARIGDVRSCQLENQPAFDRPKSQPARARSFSHRRLMIEQPAHLGRREIGIK